jgi:Bacterial regulatory helix-turn-helix protein, lysR family
LLDDLRSLIEFAHAGSIAGAADRLFRTPSAVTRQVQRLETALGAELQAMDYSHSIISWRRNSVKQHTLPDTITIMSVRRYDKTSCLVAVDVVSYRRPFMHFHPLRTMLAPLAFDP